MNEERARQGVEHLQAAAIEVIAALRAFLDVAEEIVREPGTATALAASILEGMRPAPAADGVSGDNPEPRVTRIRVS